VGLFAIGIEPKIVRQKGINQRQIIIIKNKDRNIDKANKVRNGSRKKFRR
jgi:hypothetical protein